MDAQTSIRLKLWAKRLLLWPLLALLAAVLIFLLAAWFGSMIPRNSNWVEAGAQDGEDSIAIMIESNGVHTGIIMPLVTPQKDWRAQFPASDLGNSQRPYTHVAVSWGEREVFLNTPSWTDLSPSTAITAATGGEGLLHIAHYVRPAPSDAVRILHLRPAEYAKLVAAIEEQVEPNETRTRYDGYADYDVFYSAPGTYHLGNSCNQWTSDNLAQAGIETGLWTPMAGGVMKWVPD